MENKKISVSVGVDTTESELKIFENAFDNIRGIEFVFNKNYMRCSVESLPYIIDISIGIISSIIWDGIKIAIKKILSSKEIKRKGSIMIRYKSKQLIFSENRTALRENAIDIEFDNADDLFEFIKSNQP